MASNWGWSSLSALCSVDGSDRASAIYLERRARAWRRSQLEDDEDDYDMEPHRYTAADLLAAGYSVAELRAAGYSACAALDAVALKCARVCHKCVTDQTQWVESRIVFRSSAMVI